MRGAVTRLLNTGLRSLTLGVRFLFIFFLARYLDPAGVGYYGLFTAAIGYAIYFVGLDFYVYITREILKAPEAERGRLLKTQSCLAAVLFLVVAPAAIGILWSAGWPPTLLWWFLPILLCEYANQEIYRLLIALGRQISASLLHFSRQGLWAIAVLIVMPLWPESRNLTTVFVLWGLSGALTLSIGVTLIARMRFGGWRDAVDLTWLRRGIIVSLAFLVATLALRGVQTLDRFWLEDLAGIETVAAYVLFIGVASALMTFLDAGVFAFGYPELIRLHHAGDTSEFRITLRRMLVQTIAISAVFSVLSWLALPVLLDWIGNPVYVAQRGLFPFLVLAMTINALGMVPHYALYARGRDRPIIYSHLAAFALFALVTWGLTMSLPTEQRALAVPLGLIAAFFLVLLWKTLALFTPGDTGPVSPPAPHKMAHSR
ncbi:lipopolysaccharide biosynthesis protein [Pararhodobacter sp.]|uniref:lipopolysaccharide biosynthesis protein n=1 Tax=Pararhodobacter sp. TaxID=2127056 RepID=UPI002AFE146D|nr:oligosaccharide flippase family protein [Pararhodobacter sp.]